MDLGERLISDAKSIILDESSSIDQIREAMNLVYRFFKNNIRGEFEFSDKRLINVFSLERLLHKRYLPINSEPVYEENDNVTMPIFIDSEDKCHAALKVIVHETRKYLSTYYDLKTDSLEKNCIMTSLEVSEICEKYDVRNENYSLGKDLSPGLFHCFDIVSFNVDGEEKKYLIDCTYRQFFTLENAFVEGIGMPFYAGSSIGTFMLMDERRKEIAESLLQNGYVEFTDEVCKAYFDSFLFAGRNGLYYEGLGKDAISKSDYEPEYTASEYMEIIENGGLLEDHIGRQSEILVNPDIRFDSDSVMPYLVNKNLQESTDTIVKK